MMASHRPAEPPPEPIQPQPEAPATTPQPGATSKLPESNFLVGFDWVLALGVLTLAFLLASFAVRNSDFWMHLATGRLLSSGEYSFGKDPFSYVGENRVWVNHSWLYDWGVYQIFARAGGSGVVIAKGIVLAIAAGLLLLARRPGMPMFPSVVCVGIALLAAAPRLLMQPELLTLLGLSILMLLLIRMPKVAGSWRFPIAIGVLFFFWANLDQWFFLGPVFLILYAIGHYIRPVEGEDIRTIWKAVGVGIIACMLNPHHFRVWMLPPEVFDRSLAKLFAEDVEFSRIFRGINTKGAFESITSERENPVNLYSLIGLLVLSLAGFVLNYRRASVGLALIWMAAVALALFHLRAVHFLAFVAAPVAAVNLATWAQSLSQLEFAEKTARLLHALRFGGRAAVGIIGLTLIAITYPGWLHPLNEHRRLAWEVVPNTSMKRSAEQIQQWRESGTLPAEARLLNLQPDFANYVAWYAPSEKTYFDYRFRFHRDEAADYAALRRYLAYSSVREQRADSFDFTGFLRRHGITYAVTAHPFRSHNHMAINALLGDIRDPAHGSEWVLWHVAGRSVIMGWTRQTTIPASAFRQVQFNPTRSAYSDTELLPRPVIQPPILARDSWERYVTAPPVSPADGEESNVLISYRDILVGQAAQRHRLTQMGVQIVALDRLMTPALNRWVLLDAPMQFPPEAEAVAILAVRAARRAVHASPNHPDGYYYLATAYSGFTGASFNQGVETLVTTANLARCRARLPDDPSQASVSFNVDEMCDQLVNLHLNSSPQRFDLALDVAKLASEYLRHETDNFEARLDQFEGERRSQAERLVENNRRKLAERERGIKSLETNMDTVRKNFINEAARFPTAIERAAIARRFGLVREAIDQLYKSHLALQKKLEEAGDKKPTSTPAEDARALAEYAELIELMLYVGRAEEASQILDTIDSPEQLAAMESNQVLRAEYFRVQQQAARAVGPNHPGATVDPAAQFRGLRQLVSMALGDFERAVGVQIQELKLLKKGVDEYQEIRFPSGPPEGVAIPEPMQRTHMYNMDQLYRAVLFPLNPVVGVLGGVGRGLHYSSLEQWLVLVRARVELHARLGLTYLEWGDIPSAIHYFRQAQEAPETAKPFPAQLTAKQYLNNIESAGKTSK